MANLKYPNLAAEMARTQTKYEDVYQSTAEAVGKSSETVQNWITGKAGELTVKAAFHIRDNYFPTLNVGYLFSEQPIHGQGAN